MIDQFSVSANPFVQSSVISSNRFQPKKKNRGILRVEESSYFVIVRTISLNATNRMCNDNIFDLENILL